MTGFEFALRVLSMLIGTFCLYLGWLLKSTHPEREATPLALLAIGAGLVLTGALP